MLQKVKFTLKTLHNSYKTIIVLINFAKVLSAQRVLTNTHKIYNRKYI